VKELLDRALVEQRLQGVGHGAHPTAPSGSLPTNRSVGNLLCMEEQQLVISAYFDGVNEDRFADVGALFAPAGQLIAPGVPVRTGPEEIATYFARALASYPVHHDDPFRVIHAPQTSTVEIAFT